MAGSSSSGTAFATGNYPFYCRLLCRTEKCPALTNCEICTFASSRERERERERERPQLRSVFCELGVGRLGRGREGVRERERGFKYQTCTDEKWAGDGKEKCNAVIFPFPLASRTAFFRWPPTPPHSLLLGGRMRAGLKCGIKRPGSERGRRTTRHRGRSDKLRRR